MKSHKGFTNKAKSGAKAAVARWRQAAETARTRRGTLSRRPKRPK